MTHFLVWAVAGGTIAGIFFRPKQWPEAVWACLGAFLLILLRVVSPAKALTAVGRGTDVYLFLAGMMLLSELARAEGVFDWLASLAVALARGSRARLFTLVYLAGVVVTTFLSNDATAVVLTPAVYAAVRRARAEPLPYLFACAFVANAASFVLPISNPANLVLYGQSLPPLLTWFRVFALPSLLSVAITFAALRWQCRGALTGTLDALEDRVQLSQSGRRVLFGVGVTASILLAASAFGRDLGWPTLFGALGTMLVAKGRSVRVARHVSWSVLPLVAGLFIVVEGLANAGAIDHLAAALLSLSRIPEIAGTLAASFGITAVSNILNNLPSGLMAGGALRAAHVPSRIRDALLVGVDLGPNLSVTGSLATMLWLIALRREGEHVSAWTFFRTGVIVMPPALLLATLALSL